MPDVAISCGKVSRSSQFEKCCHLAPGDSHGPKGPRNDKKGHPLPRVIAREQRDRGNPHPSVIVAKISHGRMVGKAGKNKYVKNIYFCSCLSQFSGI